MNPGDSSGMLTRLASLMIIEFFPDSTYRATCGICTIGIDADQISTGSYSTADVGLKPDHCSSGDRQLDVTVQYELKDDFREPNYLCFEGCGQRYKKIK